jgi:hypothetical protein
MIAALLALTLTQAPTYYTPAEAQTLFAQANDAYYKADYPSAKAGYFKLLDHGMGGPDVLFNLGTACLAAGELGEAVVHLERARRLSRDDDIEANLTFARKQMVDQVVGAGGDEPFLERLVRATDERGLSMVFLGVWWLGFALMFAMRWVSKGRLLLGSITVSLLVCGVCLGAAVAAHAYVARTVVEAVVLPATAKVREFPGDTAKVAFEVHSGLKVRLMEESGKFSRIRLPNGLEGWTEREGVTEL